MFQELVFYFAFTLGGVLIPSNDVLRVNFEYTLEGYQERDFVVRPKITNGYVEVYNTDSSSWVSGNSLWSDMPYLREDMRVRIKGTGKSDTNLFFWLQDVGTAAIYETPPRRIWNIKVMSEYLTEVNRSLVNGKISQ